MTCRTALAILLFVSCKHVMNDYPSKTTPGNTPLPFMREWIPEDRLVHRGIFSPDLKTYYFTVSDRRFERFDVMQVRKRGCVWSSPEEAFFNTEHDDHGMSFSPDGRHLYFSSTRPVGIEGVPRTWHIWRSEKEGARWTEPEFIDIPSLRDRLVSHPSIAENGSLYFHAADLDYSNAYIYQSDATGEGFAEAVKLPDEINFAGRQYTPWIAPNDSVLLFESLPDLYISRRRSDGSWTEARPLNEKINRHGKGNPWVSSDGKFLFYAAATGPNPDDDWAVHWVSMKAILPEHPHIK